MKEKSAKVLKAVCVSLGILVVLISIFVAVVKYVPSVNEGIKSIFKDSAQNTARKSDYYQNLTDEEKKDFDSKLKGITGSAYYMGLDKKGKEELVEKFVESEKTLKEIASDPADKTPEEIEQKIEELKQNGASEEEIRAAEQEKAYWETVETVKESTTSNDVFNFFNPGMTIRRINGIYKYQGGIFFNADFVKENVIDGKSYYSNVNQFCRTNSIVHGDESYEEVMFIISTSEIINSQKTCTNFNAESHKQFFEDNIVEQCYGLKVLQNKGFSFDIINSWENIEQENKAEYLIEAVNGDTKRLYMIYFDSEEYVCDRIQKICPEFWAQLEIEQEKAQQGRNVDVDMAACTLERDLLSFNF